MPSLGTARCALLLALAVMVGGCGSHTVVVKSSVLRLRLDEFRIIPDRVQVPAGRLKIVAYNTGTLTHIVRVEQPYNDANGNPIVLGGTSVAHPGEVVSGKVTLARGTYKLVDTIGNHAGLGEYATLIVR